MKKQAESKEPKDKILETAIRLFCRQGIHATGVDTIIAESGVARMTLYNRFGSKRGLVKAALEREGEEWRAWFLGALAARPGTPRERILAVFDILEKWFGEAEFFGCAFINAVAEHEKGDDLVRQLTLDHKLKVLGAIEALAAEAGAKDAAHLSHQIGMLMDGAIVTAMVTGKPAVAGDAKQMAQAILDAELPMKSAA